MPLPLSALDFDTKSIDTSFPTPQTGNHRVVIKSQEVAQTNTPGVFMLKIAAESLEPITDTKGKTHQPGWKLTTRITLPGGPPQASDKITPEEMEEMRRKQICSYLDAAFNTDQSSRPALSDATLDRIPNTQMFWTYKPSKDTQYGDTEVKAFLPLPTA